MRALARRPALAVWCAAALAYLLIFAASQHKIIFTDEVVFAQDFGFAALGNWTAVRIPHPPLYVSLGAALVGVFGTSLTAMRAIGGASFLLTLALIPMTMRALFSERAERAALIAMGIWALQPLALQGSLLIDIDNTIFVPAMLFFIWASANPRRSPLMVGLAFAAMLWTKLLPTALFITASVVLIRLIRREGFGRLLLGLLAGLLVFGVTVLAYSTLLGFRLNTILDTFGRTGELGKGVAKMISRGIMGGGITAVWVGVPFALMYAAALRERIAAFWRDRTVLPSDTLIVCALGALFLLSIGNDLPMGFPRYHYPIVLLVTLTVSAWLATWEPARRDLVALGALTLAAAGYFSLVIPDPLLPQYLLTFETNDLVQRLRFALQSQAIAFGLPFALLVAAAWITRTKAAGRIACVAFCVASWAVLDVTQARAEYSTIYEYGRAGGAEAAKVVRDSTHPNAVIVAPREIDWLTGRKATLSIQLAGPDGTPAQWLAFFAANKPAAVVLPTKEDSRYTQVTRDPGVLAQMAACYTPPRTIGSYVLWIRTCK
ncbi:MAG: hypothetical protein IPO29_17680 [Anaerolineae bacterium]|nr:hypothetical protein [Anaerolineae bacterium]